MMNAKQRQAATTNQSTWGASPLMGVGCQYPTHPSSPFITTA